MSHHLFWNGSKCRFIPGRKFTIRRDGVVDVSLSFAIAGNDSVCMTAYRRLTFIHGGIVQTVATDDTVTLPMDKNVFIVSTCDPHHMHKFRVSKRTLGEAPRTSWNLRWAAPPKPPLTPKRRKVSAT